MEELITMLKFGKKVNYRPLLMSILMAVLVGLLFGFNISVRLGIEVGSIMFLTVILGHYLLALPVIFNYWDSDSHNIRYVDLRPLHSRMLSILFPKHMPIKVIDKKEISQIDILGLPQHNFPLSSNLVMSEEGGLSYNLFLMINEPIKVRLIMKNNEMIDLDVSNDYVKHPQETIGKLNIFLNDFSPNMIHLSKETKKAISV